VESTQLIGLPQLVQLVQIPHLLEEETKAGIIMMKEYKYILQLVIKLELKVGMAQQPQILIL